MSSELAETSFNTMEPRDVSTNDNTTLNNTTVNRPETGRSRAESDEDEEEMVYGAKHVIKLFVPVSLCMLVVVVTIASVYYYTDQSSGVYLVYTPFHPDSTDSSGKVFVKSLYNALIVLGVVVVMTVFLVLLYKYRCYKIIHGWLILSSTILLFIFSYIYLEAVFKAYNTAFDYLTLSIFILNFGCMGMLALHWKAPLRVQQFYHIVISALLALVFIKYLPEWTLWLILGIIALWDLVAVLCPHGPLRILVNLAHERNENIFPALIYSSTVVYTIGMADGPHQSSSEEDGGKAQSATNLSTTAATNSDAVDASASNTHEEGVTRPLRDSSAWSSRDNSYGTHKRTSSTAGDEEDGSGDHSAPAARSNPPRTATAATNQAEEEDEEKGVKLGLGDFIFYSVLVGKASSSGDWATTIAAYISILMGLFFTLVLLAIFRKALPALPISIAFGLAFNFGTQYVISPFVTSISAHQIFI